MFEKEDQLIAIRDTEEEFDISNGSAQNGLLNTVAMRRVSARWVSRILRLNKIENRVKSTSKRYAEEGVMFLK